MWQSSKLPLSQAFFSETDSGTPAWAAGVWAVATAGTAASTNASGRGWRMALLICGTVLQQSAGGVHVPRHTRKPHPEKRFRTTNPTLAGRSASRRMYQGNQYVP